MKTHCQTASGNSNTFSQLSCDIDTTNSYCSDNVSVSSLPCSGPISDGNQCLVSVTPDEHPSRRRSFCSKIAASVPFSGTVNEAFYSEFDEIKCDTRHVKTTPEFNSPTMSDNECAIRWPKDSVLSIENCCNDNEICRKIPGEPLKAIASLAFLAVSWVANTSSLALTHEFMPDYAPLPDIILDNISYQSWALDVCEILLMISIVAAVVVVVFHKHRFVLLRRIWFLLGLLYFYRSLTIFVTVLPKADAGYQCSEKVGSGNITALLVVNRVVSLLSGGGLSINGKHVYCGDYIFSGHTVIFVMAYLAIKQYTPSKYYPVHWLSLLVSICGIIFLLLARGHYTIDIIVAYALTYWLWITYHTMARIPILKTRHKDNQLKGLLWWHVLRWLESNTDTEVPNEFSIPFWGLLMKFWRRCQSPPLTSVHC